jgi:hypothetical protein
MINTNEEGIAFETKPTFITTEMHGKLPLARFPTAEGSTYAVLNVTSRHRRWQRRPAVAVAVTDRVFGEENPTPCTIVIVPGSVSYHVQNSL